MSRGLDAIAASATSHQETSTTIDTEIAKLEEQFNTHKAKLNPVLVNPTAESDGKTSYKIARFLPLGDQIGPILKSCESKKKRTLLRCICHDLNPEVTFPDYRFFQSRANQNLPILASFDLPQNVDELERFLNITSRDSPFFAGSEHVTYTPLQNPPTLEVDGVKLDPTKYSFFSISDTPQFDPLPKALTTPCPQIFTKH